jgi:Fe-S cluster biogenesis protein NfuA
MSRFVDEPGDDLLNAPAAASDEERMRTLIESLSAYIEYYHGGALEMVNFDGRTLQVRMLGACKGCSLASGTLHGWVEGTVRPFFPELQQVEAVP